MTDNGGNAQPPPDLAGVLGAAIDEFVDTWCPGIPSVVRRGRQQEAMAQVNAEVEQLVPQVMEGALNHRPGHDWGVRVTAPDGAYVVARAPKKLMPGMPPAQAAAFATVLALLTSPLVRIVLMVQGYRVEFVEMLANPTEEKRIITV